MMANTPPRIEVFYFFECSNCGETKEIYEREYTGKERCCGKPPIYQDWGYDYWPSRGLGLDGKLR